MNPAKKEKKISNHTHQKMEESENFFLLKKLWLSLFKIPPRQMTRGGHRIQNFLIPGLWSDYSWTKEAIFYFNHYSQFDT